MILAKSESALRQHIVPGDAHDPVSLAAQKTIAYVIAVPSVSGFGRRR
jgi:hypothetical protein